MQLNLTAQTRIVDAALPLMSRGSRIVFPHSEPLPIELIGRVALALSREYERK
jgi:hypothetical protein